jgi:hypothetical protein
MLVIVVRDDAVNIRHNVNTNEVNVKDDQSIDSFVYIQFGFRPEEVDEVIFIQNDVVIKRY